MKINPVLIIAVIVAAAFVILNLHERIDLMKVFSCDNNTTLAEYLTYWLYSFRAMRIRETTMQDYRLTVHKHIIPKIGDIPLCELKVSDIQNFLNDEAENGNLRYGGGLSVKTLHGTKGLLSSALQKAVIMGYIPINPCNGVELPVLIRKEMTVLSVEEGTKVRVNALLDDNLDYGFAFWLALVFGLRNGEVCALRWSDIDFNEKLIHIRRTAKRVENSNPNIQSRTKMYINTPKTDKSRRDIAFTDRVRDILLDVHKRRNDIDYYGKRNADISMRDQIFLNNLGNYADTGTVEKAFKRFLKRIGIDNSAYTMHTLRHTFVTRGIEKGADIKAVSEIVGHTSVEFTLNRYGHVLDEHMRNVMTVLLEDV